MFHHIKNSFCFTRICALCQSFHQEKIPLCNRCMDLLTPIQIGCLSCQRPIKHTHRRHCKQCAIQPTHIQSCHIPFLFTSPMQALIHQFKYKKAIYLTEFFVHSMIKKLASYALGTLIPVPLHPKKLKERGYNQAYCLAKSLSKALNCPVNTRIIQRIYYTPSQSTLSLNERQSNLKHAFSIHPTSLQTATIIDDVYTTGETVNAIATLLRPYVKTIRVACIARGRLDK